MNDPNKAININLSSLLSLKAELLRKQAEVSKAKATRVLAEEFTPNKSSFNKRQEKQPDKPSEGNKTSDACIGEYEDPELLAKSQKVLEAKSKYYERMTRSGNTDENCLVLFNRKQEDVATLSTTDKQMYNSTTRELSSSGSDTDDDDEDWVEYTDCLGRTRKCLRKDLEKMKKQDTELAASMPERLDQSKPNWMLDITSIRNLDKDCKSTGPDPAESIISEGLSIMSKHDEMRANWEKKHVENLDKPNVHYQDVFFNEARQHGVGYYAFSTDESERAKQQRELEESRKTTIAEQEQRDKLRAEREKVIAERVLAAKNRQRARLGLPPLEENNEGAQKDEPKKKETKEDRRERKQLEKLKRKQEKLAAAQELERKHHVRPWDKEKDGVNIPSEIPDDAQVPTEWHYKPERLPMSQEEWNEHKRDERNPEFAPLPSSNPMHFHYSLRTNFNSANSFVQTPPTSDFRSYQSYSTTKQFQRRNYIIDDASQEHAKQQDDSWSRGVTIPPPADLDSQDEYLPQNAKKSKSSIELERSIEAGLRFLRNNCDKNTMSMKTTWTSKADY